MEAVGVVEESLDDDGRVLERLELSVPGLDRPIWLLDSIPDVIHHGLGGLCCLRALDQVEASEIHQACKVLIGEDVRGGRESGDRAKAQTSHGPSCTLSLVDFGRRFVRWIDGNSSGRAN